MYRLKDFVEEFQVVDGPLAGRKYKRKRLYEEIPDKCEHWFEKQEREDNKDRPAKARRAV